MVNHIAYDYKEKVDMIYEKEMYFNERDLENEIYFPNILIVRKAKINNQIVNNFQNYFRILKSYIKDQSEMGGSLISFKAKEQKEHLTNSIKLLEYEINRVLINVKELSKI